LRKADHHFQIRKLRLHGKLLFCATTDEPPELKPHLSLTDSLFKNGKYSKTNIRRMICCSIPYLFLDALIMRHLATALQTGFTPSVSCIAGYYGA